MAGMRKYVMMFVSLGLQAWASKLKNELVFEEAKLELKRKKITHAMALGHRLMVMSMPEPGPIPPEPESEARTH